MDLSTYSSLYIKRFILFLLRDFYELQKGWKRIALNFIVIVPIICTISFGYLVPKGLMQNLSTADLLIIMAGSILWVMFPLGFVLNVDFLRDREQKGFITYQSAFASTKLILLERLVFSAIVSWLVLLFFYPIGFLLLFQSLMISWYRWFFVMPMLFAGALFCAAFNLFFVCFIKDSSSVSNFWMRCNNPMIMFGGFFVPWHVMQKFSPLLAKIITLNPLLYITEGLRSAITGDALFFPWYYCIPLLIMASVIFYYAACYYLQKQLDSLE